MIKVFTPGYFAREDTKTPMLFAGISVAVNVALALTLFPLHRRGGHRHGAESSSGWVNAALLLFMLRRRGHFSSRRDARSNAAAARARSRDDGRGASTACELLAPYFRPRRALLAQVAALLLLIGGGASSISPPRS